MAARLKKLTLPLGIIALAAFLVLSFSYGYFSHKDRLFPHQLLLKARRLVSAERLGVWTESEFDSKSPNRRSLQTLGGLGYVSGAQSMPTQTGVLIHDERAAFPGSNLFASGHGPQAVLMAMDGQVIHTWQYDNGEGPFWWRRVHLFENGDLLALGEHGSLIKLDKDSNLLWEFEANVHHDFDVDQDGSVYVLTRAEVDHEELCGGKVMWDDFITLLGDDGKPVRQWSILDGFVKSKYFPLFRRQLRCRSKSEELFHTNTLELLPEESGLSNDRIFSRGRVLLSFRELDTIGVFDLEKGEMVWALTGMWRLQHQPTLLRNGHLLLFDNVTSGGFSRVLEIDPLSQEILWEYQGNEQNGFSSEVLGSNQRLENGNTLVVESTAGRVFEVEPDGRIVWEFVNPNRAVDDPALIAVIPDMIRLPPEFPLDWTR